MILGAVTWYCADGTLAYFNKWRACNEVYGCPDSSWMLSADKLSCFRPNRTCAFDVGHVPEEQLLAAIAYGEASTQNNFEETAAIANAVVNRARSFKINVNDLIKKYPSYSYAVYNGNERFRLLLCSNEADPRFLIAYQAAKNALDPNGVDYAHGGCFWDGIDLKTGGNRHPHYKKGYRFTDQNHNIMSLPDTLPLNKRTRRGTYDYTYQSTAGYGNTVLWIYTRFYSRNWEYTMSLKANTYLSLFLGSHLVFATPSVEILQSCKNSKPANQSVKITELMQADVRDDVDPGCEDKYGIDMNQQTVGSMTCNDEGYLFFNRQKIKLNDAENLSLNPTVKPGDSPLSITSQWWKIDKDNDSYACILAPLSDSGVGAARTKYYIIEHAFDEHQPKKIYFYFFDRDVLPLTAQ